MRLAFAGTPEFAAHVLEGLISSAHELIGVLTQPERRAGRGLRPRVSPVRRVADRAELHVLTPTTLRDHHVLAQVTQWAPDVLVVVAYGLIVPSQLLRTPRHGCINVHASLLPRWRGAAPIEHAIMAGDQESGVSIMLMDEGLDTGPVLNAAPCAIEPGETGDSLSAKLSRLGFSCLLETLSDIDRERARATPQDDTVATYAPKLGPDDAVIRWARDASQICRQVRALFSRMPPITWIGGTQLRVLAAELSPGSGAPGTLLSADEHGIIIACGQGALCIRELQLSRGKGRPMTARAALNGYPNLFLPGTHLDATP
ncbi:MAG: methionyl-tRNA formyltransferase [Pseudomonadales bacterium]